MSNWLALFLIGISTAVAYGQTPSSRYQAGTIVAVAAHQNPGESATDVANYDVSIKVGNTIYVVLYTPPPGRSTVVKYSPGLGVLVLIKDDTLTCNKFDHTDKLPILRRETLAPKGRFDVSRMHGEYFTMKQQHLAESLNLSDDQLTRIQPILEQESGEVSQVVGDPSLSRKDKLNQWGKIVQASDKKLEPLLSQAQVGKLRQLRKEQKPELKKLLDQPKNSAGKD